MYSTGIKVYLWDGDQPAGGGYLRLFVLDQSIWTEKCDINKAPVQPSLKEPSHQIRFVSVWNGWLGLGGAFGHGKYKNLAAVRKKIGKTAESKLFKL